ncbi:hypothetical protein AB185_32595 [Klebsiella oxytoca]|nr:hypothetical protein AB185_32595 [Klebsiella oxytoca]
MFAGKKSAQIREILISESAWEEMTCLFAPSLGTELHKKILDITKNTETLTALRDTLLPKLISGELSLEDLPDLVTQTEPA